MSGTVAPAELPRQAAEKVLDRVEEIVGGPARRRVVTLLACVLALDSADQATIGAAAPQLESALHISNTQLGILAATSSIVGAAATVPIGVLTDRIRRVDLLAASIVLWGAAMIAGATASSFTWLLVSRLALGAVTATAGPTLASLTGDFFPAAERGKIYGYILSGELLGGGFGFLVSGSLAGALSWRWAFALLALPAVALAVVIRRKLPEPARGGQSRLEPGATRIPDADEVEDRDEPEPDAAAEAAERHDEVARRAVREGDVHADESLVLREDPARMRLRDAVRYVLRIRTNVWLIVASAIGYFFFAGLRTFGVVFVRGHFGLGQTGATVLLFLIGLGSLVGVLVAGRLADRLIHSGRLDARMVVGGAAYIAAAVLLLPGLLVTSLAIAAPLFLLAGAALAAPNPPLDAARLDIVPARLWGRAESVRTLLRQSAQAGAPLLFGLIADLIAGGAARLSTGDEISPQATHGLEATFAIMLVPLAVSGAVLLWARRGYPSDVATAIASERAIAEDADG